MSAFGQALKEFRERTGLTGREIGEIARISSSSIYAYEKGIVKPMKGTAIHLSKVLGTELPLHGLKNGKFETRPGRAFSGGKKEWERTREKSTVRVAASPPVSGKKNLSQDDRILGLMSRILHARGSMTPNDVAFLELIVERFVDGT